jgi:hypothetical protein
MNQDFLFLATMTLNGNSMPVYRSIFLRKKTHFPIHSCATSCFYFDFAPDVTNGNFAILVDGLGSCPSTAGFLCCPLFFVV